MTTQCCENCQYVGLLLPDNETTIKPGNIILLQRFDVDRWKVDFGWYSYEGNRKVCGWYLTKESDPNVVKPILETDLYDIYIIEM